MSSASVRVSVASDQLVFFASGVLGFGPSIAVLYHALRTFDYPYTDHAYFDTRRVFLGLAVGMVVGTTSGAFTVAIGSSPTLVSLVILLLLLALFEEGFKIVYLNRKGYRGRFDTTFYGVSLGIGIAALVAAGSAYVNGPRLFSFSVASLLVVFSASLAFVHATTGAILGFGCSRGELVTAFAQAYVARVLHAAMLVPFFVSGALQPDTGVALPLFSLAVALAFTFFLYRYTYRSVLPQTLPSELRRERRRGVRRAMSSKASRGKRRVALSKENQGGLEEDDKQDDGDSDDQP